METASVMEAEPFIHTLPVELIRAIGAELDSPGQLLAFARVSEKVSSAFQPFDVYRKDAEYQMNFYDPTPGAKFEYIHGRSVKRQMPTIAWLIEHSAEIEDIKECIRVYRNTFPEGLEEVFEHFHGLYFPPSPMVLAAREGRLDVIQALIEAGVPIRDNSLDPPCEAYSLQFGTRGGAFQSACEKGHKHITKFMVDNGLDVRIDDVYRAVKYGHIQTLEALLQHPSFSSATNPTTAAIALREIPINILFIEADLEGYDILFKAGCKDTSFDAFSWLAWQIHQWLRVRMWYPYERGRDRKDQIRGQLLTWFDLVLEMDEVSPQSVVSVAEVAAISDQWLIVIQTLVEKYPSLIGEVEDDRQEVLSRLITLALEAKSVENARYLYNSGVAIPEVDRFFAQAIQEDDRDMLDFLLSSGVSALAPFLQRSKFRGKKPLQVALMADSDAAAILLMYHGADVANINNQVKRHLYLHIHRINFRAFEGARIAVQVPSRDVFRHKTSKKSNERYEQLHAMYSLILGPDYLEDAEEYSVPILAPFSLTSFLDTWNPKHRPHL
ncbi:hypothetical protein GGR54DRAFT_648538 [Hypoxylon sp. NC1633]|nr:hypothetical protein GGR54DRAFT_648538 [Hypoxylon sp. NC1633]